MTTKLIAYVIGVVVMWLVAMRIRSVTVRQALYLVCQLAFLPDLGIVAHCRAAVQLGDELRIGRVAEKTN